MNKIQDFIFSKKILKPEHDKIINFEQDIKHYSSN
jgi:hypothetical protein